MDNRLQEIANGCAADDTERPTVLVVDDEGGILRLLALTLGRAGFNVLTAGTGPDAVAAYRKHPGIELVLLDVQMPGTWDGPATLLELRRLDPHARVAFMSGSTGIYPVPALLALGALRVIAKPFGSVGRLVDEIRALTVE